MRNNFLFVFAVIFTSGIILTAHSLFANLGAIFLPASIFILLILSIIFRKKDIVFLSLLFAAIFLLGAFRYYTYNKIDRNNVKNYITGSPALVHGLVASDPEGSKTGNKIGFTLRARSIKIGRTTHEVNGFILVNSYNMEANGFRYGDIVVLQGIVNKPYSFGYKKTAVNYTEYLADKRIYAVLSIRKSFRVEKLGEDKGFFARFPRNIYRVRHRLEQHIEHYFSPPFDSVLSAILLGKRRGIPDAITDSFSKTGTLHILAISGLHVGIIYFLLMIILKLFRIPPMLSIILSIAFLACFAVLTGARASIIRATAMFSILGLSGIFRRKMAIYDVIGLSCVAILLVNPNQVFNMGFILSYVAILSLVAISPILFRAFHVKVALRNSDPLSKKARYWVIRPFLVSLAAYAGLMPLIAGYFGLVCPIVVVANLFIIPLLTLTMASGLLFITLGLLAKSMAVIFSAGTWLFLTFLINTVKVMKNVPFGHFEVNPPGANVIIFYYIILILLIMRLTNRLST